VLFNALESTMSDDDRYTRITLRIPKDLTQALKRAADLDSHSMNAEIIQRLSSTFEFDGFSNVPNENVDHEAMEGSIGREEAALLNIWRELSFNEREALVRLIGVMRMSRSS